MVAPLVAAAGISAGASLANSALGMYSSAKSAKKSYKYNSWLMAQQNEYQKEAMQNAHQWEVQDLQNAGLNPVLSAGGTGANAGGIGGGGGGVGVTPPNTELSGMVNSALGLMNLQKDLQLKDAQTDNVNADTANKQENTKFIEPKTKAEIRNMNSATAKNTAELGKIESEIKLNKVREMKEAEETKKTKKGISGYTFGTDPDAMDTALNLGILGAGAIGLGMSSAKDFIRGGIRTAIDKHNQKKFGHKGYNFNQY